MIVLLGPGFPRPLAYNKGAGTRCRRERCSMKDTKDEKDIAEALKAIGERLEAIERLLGVVMHRMEAIEVSRYSWGKGPVDAYGNPMPYC